MCKVIVIIPEAGRGGKAAFVIFELEVLGFVITSCWVTLFRLLNLRFPAGKKKMK